jgi:hypothetical protein
MNFIVNNPEKFQTNLFMDSINAWIWQVADNSVAL